MHALYRINVLHVTAKPQVAYRAVYKITVTGTCGGPGGLMIGPGGPVPAELGEVGGGETRGRVMLLGFTLLPHWYHCVCVKIVDMSRLLRKTSSLYNFIEQRFRY